MIDFAAATKYNYTKEACYIISSICYYGFASITIDEKSMIWIEAKNLDDSKIIEEYKRFPKTVLFREGEGFLSIPFYCCHAHASLKKDLKQHQAHK